MPPRKEAPCVIGKKYITAVVAGQVVSIPKEQVQRAGNTLTLTAR